MTKFSTSQFKAFSAARHQSNYAGHEVMHTVYTPVETFVQTYGVFDSKGREVGGRCTVTQETYLAGPRDAEAAYVMLALPGLVGQTAYFVRPQAQRNHKDYGASQPDVGYTTVAEAKAHAAAYFYNAAVRARKAAAKAYASKPTSHVGVA